MLFYEHFRRDHSAIEKRMKLVQRKFAGVSMLCYRAKDEDSGRLFIPGEHGARSLIVIAGAQNQPERITTLVVEVPRLFLSTLKDPK